MSPVSLGRTDLYRVHSPQYIATEGNRKIAPLLIFPLWKLNTFLWGQTLTQRMRP